MNVVQLDHLNLSVTSFKDSVDWYGRVFGFELVEEGVQDGQPWGIIKSGEALLCIYQHPELVQTDRFERAKLGYHGMNHFALRITDRDEWASVVERENLELNYGGRVDWPHSDAWYVNDPTGYEIEVAFWRAGSPAFA